MIRPAIVAGLAWRAIGCAAAVPETSPAAWTAVPLVNPGFESRKPGMHGSPEGWVARPACRAPFVHVCCASSCAVVCCRPMTRGRWRNRNTAAAFPSMPRCASRPPTAPDASACCATLARPPFALERLRQLDGEQLSYDHPKSGPAAVARRCEYSIASYRATRTNKRAWRSSESANLGFRSARQTVTG